jgi:Polyketide cyclase / dehydrase and lipid transport
MEAEQVAATTTIDASPDAIFAVLADPGTHAAIDGTGWVRASLDHSPLTKVGQVFRMAMYHDNHPDKHYEMDNMVVTCAPPRAIAWEPGQRSEQTGELEFGGWVWRYDLAPAPTGTTVTLTYDWSGVPPRVRDYIQFPPFSTDHLDNSLQHLADMVARGRHATTEQ